MKHHCVYRHLAEDGSIYIGSGTKVRAASRANRSHDWQEVFANEKVTVEIIYEKLSKLESLQLEAIEIEKAKKAGCKLLNKAKIHVTIDLKKKTGRPTLDNTDTLRVGFVITKEQWLAVNEMARRDNISPSAAVRMLIKRGLECQCK